MTELADIGAAYSEVHDLQVFAKELGLLKGIRDNTNAYIYLYRDGIPAATVIAKMVHGTDNVVRVLENSVFGFYPEITIFCAEAYVAKTPTNPETGMNWEPGDLQYLAHAEPEKFYEYGSEVITAVCADRHGNVQLKHQEFSVEGIKVNWGGLTEFDLDDPRNQTFAPLAQKIKDLMLGPMVFDKFVEVTGSSDAEFTERQQFLADMAALAHLKTMDLTEAFAFGAKPKSIREQMLIERFKDNNPEETGIRVFSGSGDEYLGEASAD